MPQAAPQAQQKTMDEALKESIAAHEDAQQEPESQPEAEAQPEAEIGAQESGAEEEGRQEEPGGQEDSEPEKKEPAKQAKAEKATAKDGKKPPAQKNGAEAPNFLPPHLREQFHTLPRQWKDQFLKQRGEYVRREAEFSRDIQAAKKQIDEARPISEALAPFIPHIQAAGVAPAAAVRNLFQTEYVLRTGGEPQKGAIVANLMGAYGITPASVIQSLPRAALEAMAPILVAALEGKTPAQAEPEKAPQRPAPPQSPPRDPRLDILLANAERQAKARQVALEEQDKAALKEFLDSGEAEFFDDVAEDMAALTQLPRYKGLSFKQLYEKACLQDDNVRTVLEKRKADEAAALRNKRAEQARRAASSVKTEPGAPQGTRKLSLEEAVKRDIESMFGPQAV